MKQTMLACLFMVANVAVGAQTPDPPHLREMPSVQRVLDEVTGTNPQDTAARQMGAFLQLNRIIDDLSSGRVARSEPTAGERRLMTTYVNAQMAIMRDQGIPAARLMPALRGYDIDPEFRARLLQQFFSPAFRANYERVTAETRARVDARRRQMLADLGGGGGSVATSGDGEAGGGFLAGLGSTVLRILEVGSMLVAFAVLLAVVAAFAAYKIRNMRYFSVRRNNAKALAAFGSDRAAREQAIIDAFDSSDFTFRYEGTNREGGLSLGKIAGGFVLFMLVMASPLLLFVFVPIGVFMLLNSRSEKMHFVLLRNIRSFSRGDLEALRFAYLAFNRGLIDDEKFHWYRFTALYGGGKTDPAEWRFSGLFKFLKSKQGDIERARQTLARYAGNNAGTDLEAQALAGIQRLALQCPQESLFADMRRRFVEGSYWLTKGELKRSAFAPADHPYGVTFGVLDGTDTELVYAGEGSIMTIAPMGSGKTQCNVFPNLLRWPGPAVVFDVKGEIYDNTSAWRAANVGPVIKFSPLDPARSACFNPLSEIRNDSLYLWEDARFVANMMIVPAKDPFWEDKAREVLTAIIADVAFWNSPEDRTISKVLRIVNRNGWDEFVTRMRKNPEIETMRDEGTNLAQIERKTLDGALQVAKANLSAWVGERIARTTRRSDWRPLDLRNGQNITLYVCVKPNELDAYLSLLRVVIAQHMRALCADLPPRGAAPILFMLDELPRLKHMPPVEEALELGRQYGIRLWMFAQSLGQIQKAYPNGDGMMASCAVRTFMNPTLQDGTAQMLAEQIGHRTGEEHGGKDKVARPDALIVTAPQLAGAEFKDLQLVFGVGSKPAKVRKMFAYRDPELVARMRTAALELGGEVAAT